MSGGGYTLTGGRWWLVVLDIFWVVVGGDRSICEKKISTELRLIHAEQIFLHKFHCFKKKQ